MNFPRRNARSRPRVVSLGSEEPPSHGWTHVVALTSNTGDVITAPANMRAGTVRPARTVHPWGFFVPPDAIGRSHEISSQPHGGKGNTTGRITKRVRHEDVRYR
jgi:hypothetical protein